MSAPASKPAASSPERDATSTFNFFPQRVSSSVVQFSAVHASDEAPLTRAEAVQLWATQDTSFTRRFLQALCSTQFQDFFWECPPLSPHTASQPFEFVVINANGSLENRRASPQDFQEHFARARGRLATAFYNLGRDAKLAVPTQQPGTPRSTYGHLAAFTRGAAAAQQLELWGTVGRAALEEMQAHPAQPVWLNTDGRGVPWLHVRLDQRPKYIKHSPYASAAPAPRGWRGAAAAVNVAATSRRATRTAPVHTTVRAPRNPRSQRPGADGAPPALFAYADPAATARNLKSRSGDLASKAPYASECTGEEPRDDQHSGVGCRVHPPLKTSTAGPGRAAGLPSGDNGGGVAGAMNQVPVTTASDDEMCEDDEMYESGGSADVELVEAHDQYTT